MKLNYSKISNVQVDGINTQDYPDFCDAFICAADYKGEPMNEEELEWINTDPDFVYDSTLKQLF